MKVNIYANHCDMETRHLPDLLLKPLESLSAELSNDYGGEMEHLWIEFQLIDSHGPFSFRFQKKVGGKTPNPLTGIVSDPRFNVGHYSVLPDIAEIVYIPVDSVVDYSVQLLYRSTEILIDKQKRLGGFDAVRFRSDFLTICEKHDHDMETHIGWD